MHATALALAAAVLAARHVVAQTYTNCYPLNSTCSPDPALGTTYSTSFNSSTSALDPKYWNITAGAQLLTFANNGAQLAIAKKGDSVTAQTSFYIMFGRVEVIMQAAQGQGIISTVNLLSDDLDEIDWEIMGGNSSFAESNYYGQGNLSQHNAVYHPVPTNDVETAFHNYTIDWSQEQIQWILDGNLVRTVPYAPSGLYPQTPSYLKVGIWAAGDPSEPKGTIAWAGGPTDYNKVPFVMTVQSITITDAATNTSSYAYADQTGSWQSIKVTDGQSAAAANLLKASTFKSAVKHWAGLSKAAKIGIACAVIAFVAICTIAWTACCIVQRKKGRAERTTADRLWDAEHNELSTFQAQLKKEEYMVKVMPGGHRW